MYKFANVTNKNILEAKLKSEWDFVDINYIKKLIESTPKLAEVIKHVAIPQNIEKQIYCLIFYCNSYTKCANIFVRFCYRLLFLFVNNKYCSISFEYKIYVTTEKILKIFLQTTYLMHSFISIYVCQ